MIRRLKLKKAVIVFLLGLFVLVAYEIVSNQKEGAGSFLLTLAGLLFIAGSLMLIYPILFGKKDNKGKVELDPEKKEQMEKEEQPATS